MSDTPRDYTEVMNQRLQGWNAAMGLRFVRASGDEVVAELVVGEVHRQPYGIVHGGVHAGIIETVASVGAALHAMAEERSVVGLENSTSFLHAVRSGTLRVTALPLTRGRRTQVWVAEVRDEADRLVASGRVRLLVLEPEAALAGRTVAIDPPQ
ncbi:PaaI family thioesterase [Nannocystaceae bacterium ST9]